MNRNNLTIPSYVIKKIENILLDDFPNPSELESVIKENMDLPHDNIKYLLSKVILKINLSLFPPITKLELILTEGCNLACDYCFEKNMLGYKKMPLDIAKKAVDLLFDYSADTKELEITHFGGEPTLNFPAIKFVTEYAEKRSLETKKSIKFKMTSNGSLITEDMAEYFDLHKIKVLLSIDGMKETHDRFRRDKFGNGTFDKVMTGFRILKKKQQWIGAKMTVMPQNVPYLFDDVTGLYNMGINQFLIGHATGIKWSETDIELFSKEYAKIYQWYKEKPREDLKIEDFDELESNTPFFGCQAGRHSLAVAVNGEISPCSKILAINNKKLLAKLGDVSHGLYYLKNRYELNSCNQLKEFVLEKGIEKEFHGGCFVSNYDENHNLFQPSLQEHVIDIKKRAACIGCNCNN